MPDLETWRTITLASAALGQSCFVLLYVNFPWWRTFLGRALFYKALILGVFTDSIFLSRLFNWGANDTFFITLYGLLGIGIWWQVVAFLRVKRVSGDTIDHRSTERRDADRDSGDRDGGGGV